MKILCFNHVCGEDGFLSRLSQDIRYDMFKELYAVYPIGFQDISDVFETSEWDDCLKWKTTIIIDNKLMILDSDPIKKAKFRSHEQIIDIFETYHFFIEYCEYEKYDRCFTIIEKEENNYYIAEWDDGSESIEIIKES